MAEAASGDAPTPMVEGESNEVREGGGGGGHRGGRGGGRGYRGGGRGRGRGGPRGGGGGGGGNVCFNCGMTGHFARDCPNARLEGDDREVINKARAQYRRCFNCGRMGHVSAECTKTAGNKACYNCGQDGHIARDCPNPRSSD